MKNFILGSLLLSMTLCLSGCQSVWYLFLNCVVDIAPDRFTFQEHNTDLSIPVFTSHPLKNTSKELKRLVVVVHGAGLNAGKSFATGRRIVAAFGDAENQDIVIAPQFLEGVKSEEIGLLFWNRRWRSGGMSLSEELNEGLPSVSSYEVMDKLIRFVTQKNPNLDRVLVLGHSAGGQFVSRYAAVNNVHEEVLTQGVSIFYIVANPSSYLYLDASRYQVDSSGEILSRSSEELAECGGYNDYKYGLGSLHGYASSMSKQIIRDRIMSRPIVFLTGQEDTERSWSLDKSCAVEVQGENRYERGLLYKHHLQSFVDADQVSTHHWLIVPGVGHDANDIFTHMDVAEKLRTLTH